MSRAGVSILKTCANAVAESRAMDVFKLSSRAMSTKEEAARGGYHMDLQKDDTKQAINRLTEEAARVVTEVKDRIVGQYDPSKFDTGSQGNMRPEAADTTQAAQEAVHSAENTVHEMANEVKDKAETVAGDMQNLASGMRSRMPTMDSNKSTASTRSMSVNVE